MLRSMVCLCTLLIACSTVLAKDKEIRHLNGSGVLAPGLPFSEAVEVGDILYLSGQVGIKPGSLELVPGGIKTEAVQTLENIKVVLKAHGYTLKDVIKCTIMLADISEWGQFNAIYATYFASPFPARSAFAASGLALNAAVEVECMAARD